MTPHKHKHAHASQAGEPARPKLDLSGLHRDWRTWLVIGLMLAAVATYVLTLDDSIQPGGIPTAAAPARPSK